MFVGERSVVQLRVSGGGTDNAINGWASWYAWLRREPSARARRDAQLTERIKEIWGGNYEVDGRPRIHAELREEGKRIGAKRVGRLMREAGIAGASRRRSTKTTTREQRAARVAPDLVDRDFNAAEPDQLWVADITYVRTWTGFLYVAVVLDAFSRRVVGWSMAAHLRTELVLDALNMALWRRGVHGVSHHSDEGSQYTSIAFGARCQEAGVRPSTGSGGRCVRQRAVRELLRDPGVRAAGSAQLSQPRRGAHGDLQAATGKKPRGRSLQEPETGPKDNDQVNFTDEQSGIMPAVGGELGYDRKLWTEMKRAHPPKNDSCTNQEEYARGERYGQKDRSTRAWVDPGRDRTPGSPADAGRGDGSRSGRVSRTAR